MKIYAIAAAIAAVTATSNAALVPEDISNENYVTQGAWAGTSPINIVWPLPEGGTPASWKTTHTKWVPKGTATVSILDQKAIKVTLGADNDYWKAPTVVFEKPTNVKPPKEYVSSYRPEPNEYGYYASFEQSDDMVALPEDYAPTKPAYKPAYKPKKGYKAPQYKPKKETLKCTLKEFTFHSISEHQYMGNNFPLEIEFKHTCTDNSVAVFHQLYNVRYVKPAEPKKYKKPQYSKNAKGYLESLIAEVYENKYDNKYDPKYDEYYGEEDEYYPGDEDDYYYTNKYEESFKTMAQTDKDELASNTLRKIANFVAANLIDVTKTGKGYDAAYTPIPHPSAQTAVIDFKFNIRGLFDVSSGYYGYIGSETYQPWGPAYVFVSGNTLKVDVKVAEFQQFVHALVASTSYPSSDATYADAFPHRYEVYNNRLVRPVGNRTVWGYADKACTPNWSPAVLPLRYYGKPYKKEKYDYLYSEEYNKYEEDDYYHQDPYKAPAKY